jgi:hypothetical protein
MYRFRFNVAGKKKERPVKEAQVLDISREFFKHKTSQYGEGIKEQDKKI